MLNMMLDLISADGTGNIIVNIFDDSLFNTGYVSFDPSWSGPPLLTDLTSQGP
jgi:hypothetical protein